MHRTSIGTWAFNIGPYAEQPVPFDEVGRRLGELGFDGMELGGFNGYPNPNALPHQEQRARAQGADAAAGASSSRASPRTSGRST